MSKGVMNQLTLSATESPLKEKGIRANVAFQVTMDMITSSTACRYAHKVQCRNFVQHCGVFLIKSILPI